MSLSFREVMRGAWDRKGGGAKPGPKALPAPPRSPLDDVPDAQKTFASVVRDGVDLTDFSRKLATHRAGACERTSACTWDCAIFGDSKAEDVGGAAFASYAFSGIGGGLIALVGLTTVGQAVAVGGFALGCLLIVARGALGAASSFTRGRYDGRVQPDVNIAELRKQLETAQLAVGSDPLGQALLHLLARRAVERLQHTGRGISNEAKLWGQEIACSRPQVGDATMEQAGRLELLILAYNPHASSGRRDVDPKVQRVIDELTDDERRVLAQVVPPLLPAPKGPETPQRAIV